MKINFNEIPKFVINLERRPDRLETVTKEFEYMGWEFERFNAVDTNSYEGCAYSHQEVAKIILERCYEYAMVFEDDIFFSRGFKNGTKLFRTHSLYLFFLFQFSKKLDLLLTHLRMDANFQSHNDY